MLCIPGAPRARQGGQFRWAPMSPTYLRSFNEIGPRQVRPTPNVSLTPTTESPMAKAVARLSPRQVLGNRKCALSIGEASAALVAMLAGAGRIAPPVSEPPHRLASLQQTEAANV